MTGMNSKCIDILAVNETRLDDTISSGEATVPGPGEKC